MFPLGNTPGAITLNVVWMERKFDAYKLFRRMYLSICNSFLVIRTVSAKKSPFSRTAVHIFCFPWGRPWGNHAKCCMDGKKIRCLQIVSQNVPICFQQFFSYSNCKCKKSLFSRTAVHIFCFPWGRPWGNHAKCCMDEKKIRCLQIVSLHMPI